MASSRVSQVLWEQALPAARSSSEGTEGAHGTCHETATKPVREGVQVAPWAHRAVLSRVAWLTCHPLAALNLTLNASCWERGSNSFQIALRKGRCPRHQGREKQERSCPSQSVPVTVILPESVVSCGPHKKGLKSVGTVAPL